MILLYSDENNVVKPICLFLLHLYYTWKQVLLWPRLMLLVLLLVLEVPGLGWAGVVPPLLVQGQRVLQLAGVHPPAIASTSALSRSRVASCTSGWRNCSAFVFGCTAAAILKLKSSKCRFSIFFFIASFIFLMLPGS